MSLVYYGTKCIEAWPAEKNGEAGYGVRYADGYESWSPKHVFEEAYQPTTALSFGHAVVASVSGQKVCRAGWNGKGMFLYYVPANAYPAQTDVAKKHWGENSLVPYGAYLAMKTADDNVVPWLASQTDVLANDWMIID